MGASSGIGVRAPSGSLARELGSWSRPAERRARLPGRGDKGRGRRGYRRSRRHFGVRAGESGRRQGVEEYGRLTRGCIWPRWGSSHLRRDHPGGVRARRDVNSRAGHFLEWRVVSVSRNARNPGPPRGGSPRRAGAELAHEPPWWSSESVSGTGALHVTISSRRSGVHRCCPSDPGGARYTGPPTGISAHLRARR